MVSTAEQSNLSELERNILALRWVEEDLGDLMGEVISKVIITIEKIKDSNPEAALDLSELFEGKKFWVSARKYSYENFLEASEA